MMLTKRETTDGCLLGHALATIDPSQFANLIVGSRSCRVAVPNKSHFVARRKLLPWYK